MSTSDDRPAGGAGHRHPGHPDTEGEYEDRDVGPGGSRPEGSEPEPVGEYPDRDVTAEDQVRPPDEGEYTDRDVAGSRRPVREEGSYTDVDPDPGPDASTHPERDDTHG